MPHIWTGNLYIRVIYFLRLYHRQINVALWINNPNIIRTRLTSDILPYEHLEQKTSQCTFHQCCITVKLERQSEAIPALWWWSNDANLHWTNTSSPYRLIFHYNLSKIESGGFRIDRTVNDESKHIRMILFWIQSWIDYSYEMLHHTHFRWIKIKTLSSRIWMDLSLLLPYNEIHALFECSCIKLQRGRWNFRRQAPFC